MSDYVDVVEVNPIMFVKQIVGAIRNGYYVQNTISGYPVVGLPYQIRLFETEPPVRNKLPDEIHTVVVEGYDIMRWLLDVQDVALQNFDMRLEGAVVDNYKSVTLEKVKPAEKVVFDLGTTPVEAPAKPKRAAKTKPTAVEEGE